MRALAALVASGAAGVLLVSFHWQRLPERVASHFNASGIADSWMSRDTNFFVSAAIIVGLTTAFALLGLMMRRLPKGWINLPNKDYWLGPERGAATRAHLATWCWAFGALLDLFLLFLFHMVYLANMSDPVAMNNTVMIGGLVVYLVVSLGSVVALLLRYSRGG